MRIRQPLALLGFSFGGALLCCSFLSLPQLIPLLWTAGIAAAFLFVFSAVKKKGVLLPAASLLILTAVLVSVFQQKQALSAFETAGGKEVLVSGKVAESLSDSRSNCYRISGAALSGLGEEPFALTADLILYGDSDLILHEGESFTVPAKIFDDLPTRSQIGSRGSLAGFARSEELTVSGKGASS